MTKKEICQKYPATAYYSGFSGLEIHHIEYGIDDYIYCVSGAWSSVGRRKYHRLKIQYDRHGEPFFRLHGYKCLLSDCIRTGAM